jgi:8-oxo-dGTP diphosphatase
MYSYEWPRMQVTADIAVAYKPPKKPVQFLLIQRGNDPYKGRYCFPGGFVNMDEKLVVGAARELKEETGLIASLDKLELVSIFDDVDRDPRGRTITALYLYKANGLTGMRAGDDAAECKMFSIYDLLDSPEDFFGFDHRKMVHALYNRYYLEY